MPKVAISTLGPTLDDKVDEHFGRATVLLIVDTDTLEVEVVDNSANRNAMQGAGIGAAEAVSERGASHVVTGHLGPKAFRALAAAGISGFNGTGLTARDAVTAFKESRLEPLSEGESHTGIQ
jgi:predicted Fe-Mo cluster-binding NifX family protein